MDADAARGGASPGGCASYPGGQGVAQGIGLAAPAERGHAGGLAAAVGQRGGGRQGIGEDKPAAVGVGAGPALAGDVGHRRHAGAGREARGAMDVSGGEGYMPMLGHIGETGRAAGCEFRDGHMGAGRTRKTASRSSSATLPGNACRAGSSRPMPCTSTCA